MQRLPLELLDLRFRELRVVQPAAMRAVRASIARHGVLVPLVVNQSDADGRPVLLDGFKRLEVLRERGEKEAPVRFVRLTDVEAAVAMVEYNAPHRGLTELEEAWLVQRLHRRHRLSLAKIAELMGRHKSWSSRRLGLTERLAESVQQDMRLGLLRASAARELTKLPRGNQAAVAQSIERHRLTVRQTAELVAKYQQMSDDVSRERMLSNVDDVIERAPKPPTRPPLPDAWQGYRELLAHFERLAVRVGQSCRGWQATPVDAPILERLRRPLVRALFAAQETAEELERVQGNWGIDIADELTA